MSDSNTGNVPGEATADNVVPENVTPEVTPENTVAETQNIAAQSVPTQAVPAQPVQPTQAMPESQMPGQPAQAQYTPGYGLPQEYVQEQESKKKKGKGVLASILGAIVAVAAGFLVRYAMHGGFTSTPTTDEVQKGIEQIYDKEINTSSFAKEVASQLGGDEADVKAFLDKSGPDFAQCVTDKVYNRVEKETKIDLAKANDEYLEKDIDTIENAVTECSEKLGESYTSSIKAPTKDEFKSGIEKIFDQSFNTPEMEKQLVDAGFDEANVKDFLSKGGPAFAECVTNELYDSVSAVTKKQLAQGNDRQSTEDLSRVSDASEKCMIEVGKEYGIG